MKLFANIFSGLSGYKSILECINKNISPVSVTGLSHIHRAHLVSSLAGDKVHLVVTGTEAEAKKLCDDINMMARCETAVLFPSREQVFTSVDSSNHEYEYMRISALARAVRNNCGVICASIEAAMQPVIPPDVLISSAIELSEGQTINRDNLCLELAKCGYQRCEKVEGASQFSVRGSIIDIFPVQTDRPVRIELWDDEIESIAEFDTDTQRRSEDKLKKLEISPASELLCACNDLADRLEAHIKKVRGKRMEIVREQLGADVRRLRTGEILPHGMKYYSLAYSDIFTISDYIDGAVFFSDYSNIMEAANGIAARFNEDVKILMEEGQLCKGLDGLIVELPKLQLLAEKKCCFYISNFLQGGEHTDFRRIISFEALQTASWGGELKPLIEELEDYAHRGYKIVLCAGSAKTLPIIKHDLEENNLSCDIADDNTEPVHSRVCLISGGLSGGFEYPENKSVLIAQGRSMNAKSVRKP